MTMCGGWAGIGRGMCESGLARWAREDLPKAASRGGDHLAARMILSTAVLTAVQGRPSLWDRTNVVMLSHIRC